MNEIKWLKITNTMFEDEKIEYLESLPDGDALINIWVKTLCLASKCNNRGDLSFANEIPYTFDLLAIKFKKTVKQIEYAYSLFSKLEMMSYDNSIFAVTNWAKYQNIEGCEAIKEYNRLKQQVHRAREASKKNDVIDTSLTRQKNVKNRSISYSISNNTSNINNKKEKENIIKEKDLPINNENFINLNVDEILLSIQGIYKKYAYNDKFHKTLTKKRLVSVLNSADKNKKLYPLQIIFAYSAYISQKNEEQVEKQFIKGSEVFLSNEVYDYAEKVDSIFKAKMEEKYGAEWQKIKFVYE